MQNRGAGRPVMTWFLRFHRAPMSIFVQWMRAHVRHGAWAEYGQRLVAQRYNQKGGTEGGCGPGLGIQGLEKQAERYH